jgi:2-dehydro-3-deoxygalactonokinase
LSKFNKKRQEIKSEKSGANMNVILIDSGTTNSRIRLVDENEKAVKDVVKKRVGVRNTAMDGVNTRLKTAIQEGIHEILQQNELSKQDIRYIVASGMITSNLGLVEVPHISGPASLNDFVHHSKVVNGAEEFGGIPCILVPGLKNPIGPQEEEPHHYINGFDVMRGEEVETFGMLEQFPVSGRGVMVLPGSHTKFVEVLEDQRIGSCLSTLGGEVLHAVQKETILSNSLSDVLIESLDYHMLLQGYQSASKVGLTRSFYQIRLLQLFTELNENERANYLVGAVLYNDIKALVSTFDSLPTNWMIVGGAYPLRKAFTYLLRHSYPGREILEASDEQVESAVVLGAQEIASRYVAINL